MLCGRHQCLDKLSESLAPPGEKAISLTYSPQIPPDHYHYRFSYIGLPVMLIEAGRKMTLTKKNRENEFDKEAE